MNINQRSLFAIFFMSFQMGCSIEVIPIHYSQVNSAKNFKKGITRGKGAPGSFHKSWAFSGEGGGYRFDPTAIEIKNQKAKLLSKATLSPTEGAVIESSRGAPFLFIDEFKEVPGPDNQGKLKYQLSHDGSSWYFFNGKKWSQAGPSSGLANSADDVNAHIDQFHLDVGVGNLYFRAFMIPSPNGQLASLSEVKVSGIAPKIDGWD